MDGEMKENETLREQIRSLEEANKAQGQERKELEKRIKKLEGEKSQLESRISNQEDKNKQLNDNLKELDLPLELINPPKTRKGNLMEGDIVLTHQQWAIVQEVLEETKRLQSQGKENTKIQAPRKGISLDTLLWNTNSDTGWPTVYYKFATSVTRKDLIRDAMTIWEGATCVKFVKITDGNYNRPHINIIEGNGCWSYVGMMGIRGQLFSIGANCYQEGIILHELGHAMGLYHEHSRTDRSQHIKINYTNVNAGNEVNFFQKDTNNYDIPYDFTSIMHYRSTAFSKNGRSTIVTVNPLMQAYIGQRKYLSFRDISIINHMYDCPAIWGTSCTGSLPNCVNEGYVGKDCSCICPPGTSGATCENKNEDYYGTPTCGGNITQDGAIITTPNYPGYYPADTGCVWWIQSLDNCKRPAITVEEFQLFTRMPNGQCAIDRLEVRTHTIYNGDE
ncbi:Zinc-dependent metalloprotease [Halocaridina rubra]|uniref:Metalloendopeptidase n=1 Tax=Halocaridina rubra TaxID=373956 RepID=A0AAN9FTT3_HALRR